MRYSELNASVQNLLSQAPERPSPQLMSGLIHAGLTEDHFYNAADRLGLQSPVIADTLTELEILLPYMYQVSDTIARRYADATRIIFADTGADLLYDYHKTRHPNMATTLLPASAAFLGSAALRRSDIAIDFLDSYGIFQHHVDDPERRLVFIDARPDALPTGGISRIIEQAYDVPYDAEQMDVSLVCPAVTSDRIQPLIEIPGQTAAQVAERLPRVQKALGEWYAADEQLAVSSTHPIQTSLYLMPRYHGGYYGLRELGGVSTPQAYTGEHVIDVDYGGIRPNNVLVTPVNPLAAAVVQYRAVHAALRHAENS